MEMQHLTRLQRREPSLWALCRAVRFRKIVVYAAVLWAPFLIGKARAADNPGDEPRDIEQVYTRPSTTPSWSSSFQKYTRKDDEIKSVAIVIGISDYSNGWAPWYDARRVRDFLIK